jgi:hypothetical protein
MNARWSSKLCTWLSARELYVFFEGMRTTSGHRILAVDDEGCVRASKSDERGNVSLWMTELARIELDLSDAATRGALVGALFSWLSPWRRRRWS